MRAAAMEDTVSLAWGLPSFRTPAHIREAAAAALEGAGTSVEVIDLRDPGSPLLFATAESEEPLALALARRGDDLLVATPAGLRVVKTFLTGASYVTGGVDTPGALAGLIDAIDKFDEFVAEWYRLGGDDVTEYAQGMLP